MLYYKSTTNGGNMKVQKFSAIATIKIINELEKMQQTSCKQFTRNEGPAAWKELLLQARDKWITGVVPHSYLGKMDTIEIFEQEGDEITVEFANLTFRINGDHVSKEQAI
jgi:dynactin complex subunit